MKNKWFPAVLMLCLIWYAVVYVVYAISDWRYDGYTSYIDMVVFLFLAVAYFVIYRKKDVLCFEVMFIPVFFLGIFFTEVVLAGMDIAGSGIGGMMNNVVTQSSYILKSRIIQMLAFIVFLLGCVKSNSAKIKEPYTWNNYKVMGQDIEFKTVTVILSLILLVILIYDYSTGKFSTWFAYELGLSDEERNQGLGHISAFCLMMTVTEFSRLSKNNIKNLGMFIRKCNPLYLIEIGLVSLLLLISGNRNEMLLIFLPMVFAYNIFIHKIKSKYIWLGFAAGVVVMIYVGLTRQGDDFDSQERNLYSATRDYSVLGYNCTYLIKYTDEHKPCSFAGLPFTLLSGVPVAGPAIIGLTGLEYKNTSSKLTTEGMTSVYSDTGLGTSLVGDLYYQAKLPFVIIFMFLFGYFMSRMHNRFLYEKKYNMVLLLIYLYMSSNAVYYIRQMWDFPIKDFIYDSILLGVLCLIFTSKKTIQLKHNGK